MVGSMASITTLIITRLGRQAFSLFYVTQILTCFSSHLCYNGVIVGVLIVLAERLLHLPAMADLPVPVVVELLVHNFLRAAAGNAVLVLRRFKLLALVHLHHVQALIVRHFDCNFNRRFVYVVVLVLYNDFHDLPPLPECDHGRAKTKVCGEIYANLKSQKSAVR